MVIESEILLLKISEIRNQVLDKFYNYQSSQNKAIKYGQCFNFWDAHRKKKTGDTKNSGTASTNHQCLAFWKVYFETQKQ